MPDIVLKDKLVVYDNERGQIGWKSYDCKYWPDFQLWFLDLLHTHMHYL
jgi:hypothetical protein